MHLLVQLQWIHSTNYVRTDRIIVLIIEIVIRKVPKDDPLTKDDLVSISKLKAKSVLSERKILLRLGY